MVPDAMNGCRIYVRTMANKECCVPACISFMFSSVLLYISAQEVENQVMTFLMFPLCLI